MADRRQEILEKVQKLLNKAESTTFGPEQEALLAKADSLMTEFAIAQWEVDQQKPNEKVKPEKTRWVVTDRGTPFGYHMACMCLDVCDFFGVKSVYSGLNYSARMGVECVAVGFPDQLMAAEALFSSLRLQLMGTMFPKYDQHDTIAANIVMFKDAGWKWSDIYTELQRAGISWAQVPETRNMLGKVKRIYDKEKEDRGEPPTKAQPANFQANFARGFQSTIGYRLADIIRARKKAEYDQEHHTSTGVGASIVLASREQEVEDSFKVLIGKTGKGVSRSFKVNGAARGQGADAGKRADLSGATRSMGGSKKALGQ